MMEPPTSMPPPMGASQNKWAKPEDWGRYKNTIQALFTVHSLSNVMRIMREDHQFHATAKMYNVHIYQKWGMRKGRPETKEKKKKRRRESTSETDSVASSSHSRNQDDHGRIPSSQPQPLNAVPEEEAPENFAWGSLPEEEVIIPREDVDFTLQTRNHPFPALGYFDPPDTETTGPLSQPPLMPPALTANVPWNGYASSAQPFLYTSPAETPIAYVPVGGSSSQPSGQQYCLTNSSAPSMGDSSWMSTVLTTPPSSVANAGSQPTSSEKGSHVRSSGSVASKTSSRSRASDNSSSRETLLSDSSSNSSSDSKSSRRSTMTLPAGSLRHLNSPDGLLFAEKTMFFSRHYISSTFSTGLWSLSQCSDTSLMDVECVKLDQWYNDFGPGLDLLHAGKVKKAFRIFHRCFDATEKIITPQDPRLVIYICQQAMRLLWYDSRGRQLAQTLLKFVSALCRKNFGTRHPLFLIMDALGGMDNFEFAKNIPPMMENYFDHLEPFFDPSSPAFKFINDLRGLTVSIMEGTGMMGIYEAKPVLERLVERAKLRGHTNLHLQIELAAILMRSRFWDDAITRLTNLRATEEAQNDPYEWIYAGVILMLTHHRKKDPASCISLGYELVAYLEDPPIKEGGGFSDELFRYNYYSSLAIVFGKLERELRDTGRIAEADRVSARCEVIMSEQYGVTDQTAELQTVN